MKKLAFILFLFLTLSHLSQAQSLDSSIPKSDRKKEHVNKKTRFYGGFGLAFGNQIFLIQMQPGFIYQFSPKFHAGSGIYYSYYSYKRLQGTSKSHIYGGSVHGAFLPIRQIETSLEFQYLFMDTSYLQQKSHKEVPALYIGAGYRTRHAVFGLRYDLLYKEGNSIYHTPLQPFIRIYF